MFPFLKGQKPRTFKDIVAISGTTVFVDGCAVVWEHHKLDVKVLALEADSSEFGSVLQYEVWVDGKMVRRFLAMDLGLENADGLAAAFAHGAAAALWNRMFPKVTEYTDPPEPGTLFTFDGDGVSVNGEPFGKKGEMLYGRSHGGKLQVSLKPQGVFHVGI